ncbi:MAG TPA: hypothetical protein VL443_12905 [Cyclobacteriaceae bacterium]|jgi:hypothetical protein|nr:hypothetical protein [Cyclobacteriaceae bacterium]
MKTEEYPLIICCTEESSDVVFVEFPDNLRVDLTAAQQMVAGRLEFTQDKNHYLVIDLSNVRHVSTEAKEFLQRPDAGLKNILGAAFIASNPVSALIANIFIKTPMKFQAKFFWKKDDAFDWINKCRMKLMIKDVS